jgi:hypothetical protein
MMLLGQFPALAGWLWYLAASSTFILAATALISLNITRIFLIKKVGLTLK